VCIQYILSQVSLIFREFHPEEIRRLVDLEIGSNPANAIPALGQIPQFVLGAEILGGRQIRPLANFQQI
jgi:hypothetical protein